MTAVNKYFVTIIALKDDSIAENSSIYSLKVECTADETSEMEVLKTAVQTAENDGNPIVDAINAVKAQIVKIVKDKLSDSTKLKIDYVGTLPASDPNVIKPRPPHTEIIYGGKKAKRRKSRRT